MPENSNSNVSKENPSFSSNQATFVPPKGVMVAVDGSDNAERALKAAIAVSKGFGAKLFIITVTPRERTDLLGPGFPGHTSSTQTYDDEMDRRSEYLLERCVDMARQEGYTNVETEAIPEFQSIPKQLLELAESKKMDLIVLGTRGLGGFQRLLLGSVSSAVVTHASCNVMIVR